MPQERQRAKKQYGNRRRIDFLYRKNGSKAPTKSAWLRHCAKLGIGVAYKGKRCFALANDPNKVERPSTWVEAAPIGGDVEMTAAELKAANEEYAKALASMKSVPLEAGTK